MFRWFVDGNIIHGFVYIVFTANTLVNLGELAVTNLQDFTTMTGLVTFSRLWVIPCKSLAGLYQYFYQWKSSKSLS